MNPNPKFRCSGVGPNGNAGKNQVVYTILPTGFLGSFSRNMLCKPSIEVNWKVWALLFRATGWKDDVPASIDLVSDLKVGMICK